MDIGVDPHSYIPTPSDTAAIHDAHVVFANGAGLEADLEELFSNAGGEAIRIQISDGLELRPAPGGHEEEEDADHGRHEDSDPHVWFDVQNVIQWVATIEGTLTTLDPDSAAYYAEHAAEYALKLERLDSWIQEQVASIPQANRKLVTNHPAFGYLERYGLEQLGAVYPVSPSAEPSARDIAALEDAIGEYGVQAVFTESTVNPDLAEQVARDTGIVLVQLFSGSLGDAGSGAESYVELMQYDVSAIVDALK
jgi:ABC-type Zn uptake system ZnuABC Zn-binding protein ZnuA